MGYVGRVGVLGAGDIGANHKRKRMWIVAVAEGLGCRQRGGARRLVASTKGQQELPFQVPGVADTESKQMGARGQPRGHRCVECSGGNASDTNSAPIWQQSGRRSRASGKGAPVAGITDWWSVPRFAGVVDGMADRLDRSKAIGNGQVPGVAALAWTALTSDLKCEPTDESEF
jgi:DNA (cytosine-5)-methyltransferase 1